MSSNVSGYGGYDLEFLSEPPDVLKCLICHSVAREPFQHVECGKLFCESCLVAHKKRSKLCPNCRVGNAQYFKDTRGNREIQDLKVKCEHFSDGCDWTGELRAIEGHLTSCPYSMVTCINKCLTSDGEEYKCLRKDLNEHLEKCPKRSVTCKYCEEEGTYEEIISSTHLKHCPMVPIKCPNEGCDKEMPSSRIKLHISTDCEYEVVKCKYSNVGCTAEMPRKDLSDHENDDKLHLHVLIKLVAELQEQMQKDKLAHAKLQTQIRQDRIVMTVQMKSKIASVRTELLEKRREKLFKLTEYEEYKALNVPVKLPSFYTNNPVGYHMCLKVYLNGIGSGEGTHVSVLVSMVKGSKDNESVWPFCGKVTITLLNQFKDEEHVTRDLDFNAEDDMRVGKEMGYGKFIAHDKLDKFGFKYLKDDTLYFRVSVKVSEEIYKPWLLM